MEEFTTLKFRTMRVDTDDSAHREYIRQTMSADAAVGSNGLYKLDRTIGSPRSAAGCERRASTSCRS